MASSHEITALLLALEQGDPSAGDQLMPLVMEDLRRIASHYMRKERPGHVLQTTALVNEAWLRLVDQSQVHWQSRKHFFVMAARCMRHILVEYARARDREKRGGGAQDIPLSEAVLIPDEKAAELLAVDEALQDLAKQDERKGKVVELRYFGGYSVEEVMELLEISESTVQREWRLAKAWLQREFGVEPKAKQTDES